MGPRPGCRDTLRVLYCENQSTMVFHTKLSHGMVKPIRNRHLQHIAVGYHKAPQLKKAHHLNSGASRMMGIPHNPSLITRVRLQANPVVSYFQELNFLARLGLP